MYVMSNELTALAVIPGLLLIGYVYGKDKIEKEPLILVLKLMVLGVISCIAAGYAESAASSVLPVFPEGSFKYALQTAFCLAAFWEEILKYLALRLGSWKAPSFNYRFDGIVYGVSAAVGFAIYENIYYVAAFGVRTAIARAFLAVPLHAFCGAFMGVFYSYSKKADILGRYNTRRLCTFFALVVPMLIHGIYDFIAMYRFEASTPCLLVFVVLLYIAALRTIKKLSEEDYHGSFYPQARVIEYDVDEVGE